MSKVLLISPHTDDIEFWASGFVLKNPQHTYHHICLSICPQAIKEPYTQQMAYQEWLDAQELLGIEVYTLLNFREREYPMQRQEILQILYDKNTEFQPDIVISSCQTDVHQDHSTVAEETIRAFPRSQILQFTGSRSITQNNYNYFIKLNKATFKKKCQLIELFQSQVSQKHYRDMVINTMKYYGTLFNEEYLEPFIIYRAFQ